MHENWKISGRQFKILVILCFIGTSILLAPGSMAAEAKHDAWIASLLGLVFSLLLVWLYNSVSNHFPNMTLIEYTEKSLGKWIGKAVFAAFTLFMFFNCSTLIYIVGDFITTQIMPETPIQFTNILFAAVIVLGTRLGLETFSRTGEILYPWVLGLFLILTFFLLSEIDVKNVQPIFEYGMKPILRGSIFYISFSTLPLIPLLMIFPTHVNNLKVGKKSFLMGTLIGGIIVSLIVTFSVLVLGHSITARNAFPSYILAKKISIADFLERIEAIIAVLWIITMFFKTILFFYGSVLGLAQILNLKDYRRITLPMGMILVVLSLVVYPNSTYAATWNTTTWVPVILTFGFLYPLVLLIISKIRK